MSIRVSPVQILLVEDNPGDVRLIREAFLEGDNEHELSVVADGIEAMAFVRHEGQYANAPRPDIILLDLNLPRKDGREVLAELKKDNSLRRIPVIVFSASESERDVSLVYDLYANCFIPKPLDLERFIQIMKELDVFWLRVVTLPPA